jgi:hypothetical protein
MAWGMMGRGAEMNDLQTYEKSLSEVWEEIKQAADFNLNNMDGEKWKITGKIFRKIDIMKSNAILVGNSKLMAHVLPKLISPVDCVNTCKFLHINYTATRDKEKDGERQWTILKSTITDFFMPILNSSIFEKKYNEWQQHKFFFHGILHASKLSITW